MHQEILWCLSQSDGTLWGGSAPGQLLYGRLNSKPTAYHPRIRVQTCCTVKATDFYGEQQGERGYPLLHPIVKGWTANSIQIEETASCFGNIAVFFRFNLTAYQRYSCCFRICLRRRWKTFCSDNGRWFQSQGDTDCGTIERSALSPRG